MHIFHYNIQSAGAQPRRVRFRWKNRGKIPEGIRLTVKRLNL
jgi:hypothetical protein